MLIKNILDSDCVNDKQKTQQKNKYLKRFLISFNKTQNKSSNTTFKKKTQCSFFLLKCLSCLTIIISFLQLRRKKQSQLMMCNHEQPTIKKGTKVLWKKNCNYISSFHLSNLSYLNKKTKKNERIKTKNNNNNKYEEEFFILL